MYFGCRRNPKRHGKMGFVIPSELLQVTHRLNLPTKQMDFYADKWTCYFLDKEELEFLDKVRCDNMPKIGKYANVEVGITTGSNGYFTVPQNVVDMY